VWFASTLPREEAGEVGRDSNRFGISPLEYARPTARRRANHSPGNRVDFSYISGEAGDHPPAEAMLSALDMCGPKKGGHRRC
jgi:hypothetical protein